MNERLRLRSLSGGLGSSRGREAACTPESRVNQAANVVTHSLPASEEVIEGEIRHDPHPQWQRRLVGEKECRVILRRGRGILVSRRHAQEQELARNLLLEVREV